MRCKRSDRTEGTTQTKALSTPEKILFKVGSFTLHLKTNPVGTNFVLQNISVHTKAIKNITRWSSQAGSVGGDKASNTREEHSRAPFVP